MRILTVLVRHGSEDYAAAEQQIAALFDQQLPSVEREVIVVDNALPAETVVPSSRRTLLGGDNRVREFTGFDRAIDHVGGELASYGFIHFATSAFNTLYTAYLERFTLPVLDAASGRSVCLGHIDCYNDPIRLEAFVSQHWIRTCFFFLPPAIVRAIGPFVSAADGSRFFSGDPANPFRPNAPISERYRSYIIDWLTGGDLGQGVTWHSRLALTFEGLASFEQKALCILNEQLLGARLRALGCPLVDITWLSTHLPASGATASGLWHTPWATQVATRDRDAVSVC